MNSIVKQAKEEIGLFDRPSINTSRQLIEEVERLETKVEYLLNQLLLLTTKSS